MRCPKCGYISFDNLDTCLKCNKDISEATQAFQGSTLKVETPSFLKISVTENNGPEIEGAAEMDGDIEFADPDLEILVDEDADDDDDGIDFKFDEEDASDDDAALAQEFGEVESFGDDDDELDLSADLGQFEDVPEEETFSFGDDDDDVEEEPGTIPLDIPDELADISDLSPPGSFNTEEAVAEFDQAEPEEDQSPAEPDDDLDFSNLDMDFDLGDADEAEDSAAKDDVAASEKKQTAGASPSDMDEELNFDLDLGGLSIHEENKS